MRDSIAKVKTFLAEYLEISRTVLYNLFLAIHKIQNRNVLISEYLAI
jgi:hypothetical protein